MRFERSELLGRGTEGGFYSYFVTEDLHSSTQTQPSSKRPRFRLLQITDIQLADLSSPNRFEFVNKLIGIEGARPFIPGHRPSELLTIHAAIASVKKANSIHEQRQVDAALFTGDLVDSSQLNEAEAILKIIEGGDVDPRRLFGEYEGVQGDTIDDPFYYKPDAPSDLMGEKFGFPRIKGYLDAALGSQKSPGLSMPWLVANGNHEVLIQGMGAANPGANGHAVGDRKPVAFINTDIDFGSLAKSYEADSSALLPLVESVSITPQHRRRPLFDGEFGAMLRSAGGRPVGHGLDNYSAGELNFFSYFEDGDFVVIAIDTANRAGGASGTISKECYVQLENSLERAKRDFPTALIIVISHHSLAEIDFEQSQVSLDQIESSLNDGKVLLWLSGHTHKDRVIDNSSNPRRTFVEVTSASIADWPATIREIEVFDDPSRGEITLRLNSHVVGDGSSFKGGQEIETGDLAELLSIHSAIATNTAYLYGIDVETARLDPLEVVLERDRFL